jgi:hypothetical protein
MVNLIIFIVDKTDTQIKTHIFTQKSVIVKKSSTISVAENLFLEDFEFLTVEEQSKILSLVSFKGKVELRKLLK